MGSLSVHFKTESKQFAPLNRNNQNTLSPTARMMMIVAFYDDKMLVVNGVLAKYTVPHRFPNICPVLQLKAAQRNLRMGPYPLLYQEDHLAPIPKWELSQYQIVQAASCQISWAKYQTVQAVSCQICCAKYQIVQIGSFLPNKLSKYQIVYAASCQISWAKYQTVQAGRTAGQTSISLLNLKSNHCWRRGSLNERKTSHRLHRFQGGSQT